MKKSVLFDLDGTLWEVIDSTYKSANIIANKYNLKEISKETICNAFGLNREGAASLYFPNTDLNEAVKLIDEIAIINIDNLKKNGGNVYPNVKEVLNNLVEKYDLYIVSNTAEVEYINAFLNSSKTKKFFKDYIAASSLNISKAEATEKIINENKIEKAAYVGDTIIDLEASKAAEIPFVLAKYGFGKNLQSKYYINELKELPKVLEKII